MTLTLAPTRARSASPRRHAGHVSARLAADGHVEQGEHGRPAGLDRERGDLLSTDGGHTYPTCSPRARRTTARGRDAPETETTTARVKVEAVGNIFFDVSNTNFTSRPASRRRHLRLRHRRRRLRHRRLHPHRLPPPPPPPPPPPARCRVPRVLGLRLGAAKTKIRRAHCSVGNVRRVRSQALAARPRGQASHRGPARSSAGTSRSSWRSAGS